MYSSINKLLKEQHETRRQRGVSQKKSYTIFSKEIQILEEPQSNVGSYVWDCCLFMCDYFERQCTPSFWVGKKVLELGSGTGLLSIGLSLLGAEVWATDQAHLLPLLQQNISQNCSNSQFPVHVEKLDWSEDITLLQTFDYIVASEILYLPKLYTQLFSTIKNFCDKNTVVFIGYKERGMQENTFFELFKEEFSGGIITQNDDKTLSIASLQKNNQQK